MWQARWREEEEKKTFLGAYVSVWGSQLLSDHATQDSSCSGDGVRFGRTCPQPDSRPAVDTKKHLEELEANHCKPLSTGKLRRCSEEVPVTHVLVVVVVVEHQTLACPVKKGEEGVCVCLCSRQSPSTTV